MTQEVHQRHSAPQKPKSMCQEMVPVIIEPYKKSKLKTIPNNKLLYDKDITVYQVMYKVHVDLDGAKNLYFYVQKDNGRYVQLQPDMKMERLFTRYKSRDGALRIYYDNNYIGNSKCLDYAFYLAQGVMAIYAAVFGYAYLKHHEYI